MAVSITLRLQLDRIRFFVPVCNQLHKLALGQLLQMKTKSKEILPSGSIKLTVNTNEDGTKRYLLSYRPDGVRTIAKVEVGRTPDMKGYFSLDLFPSQFKPDEFSKFQSSLGTHFSEFSYTKLYQTANVSYTEFALDSISAKMGTFIPIYSRSTTSMVHQLPDNTGGIYLGARSGNHFHIYDKRRQLLQKHNITSKFNIQTRIEARLHSLGMPATQIHSSLKNPFLKLSIADVLLLEARLKKLGHLDAVKQFFKEGTSKALHDQPTKVRRVLRRQLQKSQVWWWTPKSYWSQLPDAMKAIAPDEAVAQPNKKAASAVTINP